MTHRRHGLSQRKFSWLFGRKQNQQGSIAPFMVLALTGGLMAAAYTLDATRMTSDSSQLKRATDAAALAVAREYSARRDDFAAIRDTLADKYVRANLGLDSALEEALSTVTVTQGSSADGNPTFQVEATFTNTPTLSGNEPQALTVHSTAEVRVAYTEVALVLPNSGELTSGNLSALRRLGKNFAETLITDNVNTWLAVVPFSQTVNVYDSAHTNRVRQWARSDAIRPVELTSLFRTGYTGLTDARMPDLRTKRVCLYRGLNQGDNYFWDQAPGGQFYIHYRHDLPENAPGFPFISWRGPNPDFGQANGVEDIRNIVADKGCPVAPLLPLTDNLDDINARFDAMVAGFNTNHAIALGWGAMALAPAFQGDAGWGAEDDLPLDFDDGSGEHIKAVVMLVKTTKELWFDSDAYNSYVGKATDGGTGDEVITRRFASLCASMRARHLRLFLIATGADEGTDDNGDPLASASRFRQVAGPGLQVCAEKDSDLTWISATDFAEAESQIQARLDEIVSDLRQQGSFIRLIE
ncbi:pilus assembly protein TadG-related protein [Insolitispirillum peregrinum]|uniref:Flp pilus assembly protein TadG n=1 Tax=Insolitispirillum peregrinum TaxID=80876 RepID=A0A1N7QCN4_9PROT|nr:pilus assembly protein TadG-related protein [Insolitispirillum peregrinum]SIT20623.1 Flp pilus assembly protein TadG [Insolitispirillum peregrinum]